MATLPVKQSREPVILNAAGLPIRMQDTAHFAASRSARELKSWNPITLSPDAELNTELSTLVERSRDISRNHGVASGAVQTLVDNVVGTGLRLRSMPDYQAIGRDRTWAAEWTREVESRFQHYAASVEFDASRLMNFYAMTQVVFRYGVLSGEALAIPYWLPGGNARYATQFQLVEPDRLSNPFGQSDTEKLRGGVEINRYGAPVAYHIRKSHPGDLFHGTFDRGEWERIPARTRFGRRRVLHVFEPERAGQHRGKPKFASILAKFRMLDHYERTELQAAVVNAMVAAFVKTNMDGQTLAELFGDSRDYLRERAEWEVKLQGASILPLFPGDEMQAFTPSRPAAGYSAFVENLLRHIATGTNMPYELLAKDFSKTNYSSARAALLEAWRFFMTRRQWLSHHWAQPVYELWLEEAVNKGEIEAPGFYEQKAAYCRCQWMGPGRGHVDPEKEGKAVKLKWENGTTTLAHENAEQGQDWETTMEQRAEEVKRAMEIAEQKGIPVEYLLPTAKDFGRASPETSENEGN